jgi:hypothetical protein
METAAMSALRATTARMASMYMPALRAITVCRAQTLVLKTPALRATIARRARRLPGHLHALLATTAWRARPVPHNSPALLASTAHKRACRTRPAPAPALRATIAPQDRPLPHSSSALLATIAHWVLQAPLRSPALLVITALQARRQSTKVAFVLSATTAQRRPRAPLRSSVQSVHSALLKPPRQLSARAARIVPMKDKAVPRPARQDTFAAPQT